MVYGFDGYSFFILNWTFHDYLDTCCFECLICMCFVFLYLHLFSAIEHVSHGRRSRNTLIIIIIMLPEAHTEIGYPPL